MTLTENTHGAQCSSLYSYDCSALTAEFPWAGRLRHVHSRPPAAPGCPASIAMNHGGLGSAHPFLLWFQGKSSDSLAWVMCPLPDQSSAEDRRRCPPPRQLHVSGWCQGGGGRTEAPKRSLEKKNASHTEE